MNIAYTFDNSEYQLPDPVISILLTPRALHLNSGPKFANIIAFSQRFFLNKYTIKLITVVPIQKITVKGTNTFKDQSWD